MTEGNPFSPLRNPFLWWDWRSRQSLYVFYTRGGRTELADFEKELLIPELIGRVKEFKEIFSKIKNICDHQQTKSDINSALGQILRIPLVLKNAQSSSPADDYLAQIKTMVEISYQEPLTELLRKFPSAGTFKTLNSFTEFLNQLHFICSSITQSQEELFLYNVRGFLIVKNLGTGEQIYGPPENLAIALFPFQVFLHQLVRISTATEATIQEWKKQRLEARKEFMAFLSSHRQLTATNRMLVFQICTILFAVILSGFFLVANDPFVLLKKNGELGIEINKCNSILIQKDAEISELEQSMENQQICQPQVISPKK